MLTATEAQVLAYCRNSLATGVGCCPKRDNCLRFVHWTQDSRT